MSARYSIRLTWLWLLLGCSWLLPSAHAQQLEQPAGANPVTDLSRSVSETTASRFEALWFERERLLAAGDEAGAHQRFLELLELRNATGLTALPPMSRALLLEALELAAAGDDGLARQRVESALELSPGWPEAYQALARIRGRSGVNGGALSARLRGLLARKNSFWGSTGLAARGALTLGLTLGLAGALLGLGLMLRYQRLIRHQVYEVMRRRVSGGLAQFLGWVALVLPLVLSFDLLWAGVYWGFLVWRWLSLQERVVEGLALVMICLAVVAGWMGERMSRPPADPLVVAAVDYLEGLPDASTVAMLERLGGEQGTPEQQLLLALVYDRLGESRKAIEVYRRLQNEAGFAAAALTNLGVIHYRLDEKDRALQSWLEAERQQPDFPPVLYNLFAYYTDQIQTSKGSEYLDRFTAVAPERLQQRARGSGSDDNLLLARFEPEQLWRRTLEGRTRSAGEAAQPPATLLDALLATPVGVVAILVLVLNLAVRSKPDEGLAQACLKCGKAYCSGCKTSSDNDPYCLQCVHLFRKRDGVSPQMRAEKLVEIRRHEERRHRLSWALALLPGLGPLFGQRSALGLIMLTVWCLGLSLALMAGGPVSEPLLTFGSGAAGSLLVGWVLAGLMWLAALGLASARR